MIDTIVEQKESQYGKGLGYCLGLFLAHAHELISDLDFAKKMRSQLPDHKHLYPEEDVIRRWIYGASDHLNELDIDSAPEPMRKDLKDFEERTKAWGSLYCNRRRASRQDAFDLIEQAKEFLRLIDEANGVKTIKSIRS